MNAVGADFGQLLRIGNRKGSQSDRVDQLKDCGVCTDAEREREDRDSCEDRASPQNAQPLSGVADQVIGKLRPIFERHVTPP